MDITPGSFYVDNISEDPSVEDPPLNNPHVEPPSLPDFTIILIGTKRGKPMLFDKDGYQYIRNRSTNTRTYWICATRNKTVRCKASVIEQHGTYSVGNHHRHVHPPKQDSLKHMKMRAVIKRKAEDDLFAPASKIVKLVVDEKKAYCPCPTVDSLRRMVNRHKRKLPPRRAS